MGRAPEKPSVEIDLHVRFVLIFASDPSVPAGFSVSIRRGRPKRSDVRIRTCEPDAAPIEDRWPADPKDFGRAVCEARKTAGISQVNFARKIGIDDNTLRSIEHARRRLRPEIRIWIVKAFSRLDIHAPISPSMSASSDGK